MKLNDMTVIMSVWLLASVDHVSSNVYYIVPSQDYACSPDSCVTLSTFADNYERYVDSNTTLLFTVGSHKLGTGLSVSNVTEFSMLSANDTNMSSMIICTQSSHFNFSNVGRVYVDGLLFVGCGGNRVESVDQLTIHNSQFIGQNENAATSLTIIESNVTFIDTRFFANQLGSHRSERSLSTSLNHLYSSSAIYTVGGALIATNSNIFVDKCQFEGNSANIGGAIFLESESNTTIINSTFTSNKATGCQNELCFGGALFLAGRSRMLVLESTFENNTSDRDGGMAAVFNATLSLVSQCDLYNNTAARYGGTITIHQGSALSLEETTLRFNKASTDGGMVYAESKSSIIINSSTITNNSATYDGGVIIIQTQSSLTLHNSTLCYSTASSGGVIYAKSDATISMSYSKVFFNRANHLGGVIFLTENSTVSINHSDFWHNEAEHGGVAYIRGSKNFVAIHKSNFMFNTVVLNGGVLQLLFGGRLHIDESIFENNSANREGGVLYGLSMHSSEVFRSTFIANKANIGGVFTIRDGSAFFAQESVFCNNVDSDLGAVIYTDDKTENVIQDCNFVNNSGNYGGVVHATRNCNVTVDNCTFDNNTANIDGGTLYGRAGSIIEVGNSSFTDNTAINDAVMLAFDRSRIMLDNVTFINNEAGHDGGAVYVYDYSNLTINNCTFIDNRANNSGGSIYGRKHCTIHIVESIIYNGSTQNSGGAVYAQEDSEVTIESSTFTNNSADIGGVLNIYVRSTAYITNCRLSRNRAKQLGGAVNGYQLSTIHFEMSSFDHNMADFGGVSFIFLNSYLVFENCTFLGNVAIFDGVIRVRQLSTLNITVSTFMNNTADSGGVVYAQDSNINIETSFFIFNSAKDKGSVIFANNNSNISIHFGNFSYNMVENDGGVMAVLGGTVTSIESSTFISNKAHSYGGVVGIQQSNISVLNTTFCSSTAGRSGGIMRAITSSITIKNCTFTNNSANDNGGIVDARSMSSVIVLHSFFLRNTASKSGGVLYLEEQSNANVVTSIFQLNKAQSEGGAISAKTMSNIIVTKSMFSHNEAEKGAAISAKQRSYISFSDTGLLDNTWQNESRVIAYGELQIYNNTASYGGGIYLSESDLYVGIHSNFSCNCATMSGGGVYANDSSITLNSTTYFNSNRAIGGNGGGINAQNTYIGIGRTVDFISNQAMYGGGISLANSKLYDTVDEETVADLNFVSNHAEYGGALYINDKYECLLYRSTTFNVIECFFQNITKNLQFNFDNNSAISNINGDNLFGGLLDRCTIANGTNSPTLQPDGASRLKNISNIMNFDTVYSEPVRLCLCRNNEPDCSQPVIHIQVVQGNEFTVGPIAAVDQVRHPVTAIVMSAFNESGLNTLLANHMIQEVGTACSNLTYQVSFPSALKNYTLILYANGPCDQRGISEFPIDVYVLECSCAIGFIRNKLNSKCNCICDTQQTFSKYIKDCDSTTESVIRQGRFWITYLNDNSSNPYFIYPYCPLDYCQPPSKQVPINLNTPDGSDAQCANNRHGILCGSCQPNYSLSLGSSMCIKCPDDWYGVLIGIIIAATFLGLMFVVLILWLNLTVATGTLNSIIFYANIIYANRSVYFRQLPLTFIPVFISWLNLDIGFDTCFFKGMDAYVKTWLQLAFPLYIIFLVIIIIWMCSCSSKFSNLLGKRNPVATLATLILLSYTKLLETVTASLSFVPLQYPNHTTTTRWLPDANVEYGKGKHIALICVAIIILIMGLLYTTLITSWQWLLHSPRSKIFIWTRNQKLHSFIDTYHIPHTPKHRYWTGLRLLIRVIVYLISTFSVSIDPRITLLSTVVITSCLLSYKTMLMIRVYKNWLFSAIDSYVYFNIIIFTIFTWYTFSDSENYNQEIIQNIVVYLSTGTIFILFVLVFIFHIYRYGSAKLYSFGQNSKLGRKVKAQVSYDQDHDIPKPLDSTLFDAIDNPREDFGHNPFNSTQSLNNTVPTTSTVSMTDCDKSTTVEYHQAHNLNAAIYQDQENGVRESDRVQPSNTVKSEAEFEVIRKLKPKLSSFRAKGTSNEDITKPLLKEHKL